MDHGGDPVKRVIGVLGILAPALAALVVLLAGLLTPGYDPLTRTISRLAEPGLPTSAAVGLTIFMVGAAILALAAALGPGALAGRVMLGCAGTSMILAAAVPLNPGSPQATTVHRIATAFAMLALTGSPLVLAPPLRRRDGWGRYGPLSFGLGAAAVAVLLVGLALLPTAFALGAWERCFLGLPMVWMVLVSARLLRTSSTDPIDSSTAENSRWAASVSEEEMVKATTARASSRRS
jgi:Protein of unknown function (DUF998)